MAGRNALAEAFGGDEVLGFQGWRLGRSSGGGPGHVFFAGALVADYLQGRLLFGLAGEASDAHEHRLEQRAVGEGALAELKESLEGNFLLRGEGGLRISVGHKDTEGRPAQNSKWNPAVLEERLEVVGAAPVLVGLQLGQGQGDDCFLGMSGYIALGAVLDGLVESLLRGERPAELEVNSPFKGAIVGADQPPEHLLEEPRVLQHLQRADAPTQALALHVAARPHLHHHLRHQLAREAQF